MTLSDRILRALSGGLPVDPVLWAQGCLQGRHAANVSAAGRLTLEAWAWAPLSMSADGRLPVRWNLDGDLPRPSAPDLWALTREALHAVGDPVRPTGVLTCPDLLRGGPAVTAADREARRGRLLSALGDVLDEPSLELIAVLPAGALVLARKRLVRVPRGLDAVWGPSWGDAADPEPPEWRSAKPHRTRAEWVERGLRVAESGDIGAPDARLAVSLAAIDERGLLRARLASAPAGSRVPIREWATAAAALRGSAKRGSERPPTLERGSHAELAEALLARLRDDGVELAHDGADLRMSVGGSWAPCDGARLSQTLQGWDGAALSTGGGLAVQANTVTGALALLKARVAVSPGFFEAAPPGVAIGGRLILPTGEDRPISADDRVLAEHVIDGRVDGPRSVTRWLRFLRELFRDDADQPQKIAYLQEWLGAALFGEATSYRGLPFLVGGGFNGKSALCFAVADLFAEGAVCHVDPRALAGDRAEYYLSAFRRARLNVVADVPLKPIAETSYLKQLVTGDVVTGRDPAGKPFALRSSAAWLLAGNDLPPSADTSPGLASRFLPLRLSRVFRDGEPGTLPPAVLADLLRAERVGVILWAAEGLRRLKTQGAYTMPPSALRERRLWMHGDSATAWWHEAIDHAAPVDLRPWRSKAALYACYETWAKGNHQPVLSAERWGQVFGKVGAERQCRRGVTGYRLSLSATPLPISVDGENGRG